MTTGNDINLWNSARELKTTKMTAWLPNVDILNTDGPEKRKESVGFKNKVQDVICSECNGSSVIFVLRNDDVSINVLQTMDWKGYFDLS